MSAQATARGTLGGTPLSNLLVYGLDKSLTGTLVVEDPDSRKCGIRLKGGIPRKVKVSDPVARLGDLLVESGACDRTAVDAAFDASRTAQVLHGRELVRRALVDAETIEATLAEQLIRKLEWMSTLSPESVFGYYDGADYLEAYAGDGVDVDPLEVIWRVVGKSASVAAMDAILSRLGNRELKLHPGSRIGRFGFSAKERGMLDVLRMKPQPFDALTGSGLLPPADAKRVLYALVITRHIDVGSRPLGVDSQSAMAAATAPAAPSPPSPAVQARVAPVEARPAPPQPSPTPAPAAGGDPAWRAEIVAAAERLDSLNHYEVLGVTKEDGPSVVQGAFFQLAKKWHPDRIGSELSDVRDVAARVFARMSEAHQTLSSPELRAEYDQAQASPSGDDGEQAAVQKVLLAATAFQKAEILLRRGQVDAAETELKFAVENDPDQAEYAALYADLQSQRIEREPTANHAPYVQVVNEARKREPQNRKVRLYRARVLRRSGDMDGAVREWKGIIEMDPGNVEAARELRLFEMRRPRKPQESKPDLGGAGGGKDIGQFFNKLFKR